MHPLLNIAISAARQAGDIILRHSEQIHKVKIHPKPNNDVFSEVDVKAEQAIINTILKAYPQHGIIAEESGKLQDNSEYLWLIDPLDGTKNYLHGFPFYCVSIAVLFEGKVEHAVIYDPLRHDCFTASRGRGARLNNQRLRVSKAKKLNESVLSIKIPNNNSKNIDKYTNYYATLAKETGGFRSTGSAALDLAYVAAARTEGCIIENVHTWDIAAGSLLVLEAGGFVGDTDGSNNYLKSGNIIASTPKIFKGIQTTIT